MCMYVCKDPLFYYLIPLFSLNHHILLLWLFFLFSKLTVLLMSYNRYLHSIIISCCLPPFRPLLHFFMCVSSFPTLLKGISRLQQYFLDFILQHCKFIARVFFSFSIDYWLINMHYLKFVPFSEIHVFCFKRRISNCVS